MTRKFYYLAALLVLAGCSAGKTPGEYVDPQIGGIAPLLTVLQPQVQRPHSMVRVATVPDGRLSDRYLSDRMFGVMLNQARYRQGYTSAVMPTTGDVNASPLSSWYDKSNETLHPWMDRITLDDYGIEAEWSTTERGLILRFDYPQSTPSNLVFRFGNEAEVTIKDGSVVYGWEKVVETKQYFYAVADHSFPQTSETHQIGSGLTAWLSDSDGAGSVTCRIGISYVDVDQAKANYEKELKDKSLLAVEKESRKLWEDNLGRIRVKGGTDKQKTIFYTSLYRVGERMIDYNEYGRYYDPFARKVRDSQEPFWCDDWTWDTYRCKHALEMILDPSLESQRLSSYARMYNSLGWVPMFPEMDTWGEVHSGGMDYLKEPMIGNHVASIAAEAIRKGITDWDIETLYEGLRKNVFEGTVIPWRCGPACELDKFYDENGWLPALELNEEEPYSFIDDSWEKRQTVSVSLDHSYDDWCLAQVAKYLGKEEDCAKLMERSKNYLKVWNPETGYFQPKNAAGEWIDPFDIEFCGGGGARRYFSEVGGRAYVFHVQHDIPKLIELCGGKEAFVRKIDDAYNESPKMGKWPYVGGTPDATGLQGMIPCGNEQAFHIPWLYDYAGAAWKTQFRVRQVADIWFSDTPEGLSGDDDGGAMCAWYVFAAMGFYPVNPASGEYALASPMFESVEIDLPSGKTFTIKAPEASDSNKYVKEVKLNGRPLDKPFITHEEIVSGSTLEFELTNDRSKAKQFN